MTKRYNLEYSGTNVKRGFKMQLLDVARKYANISLWLGSYVNISHKWATSFTFQMQLVGKRYPVTCF